MKPFYNVVGAAIVENGKLFAVRRVYGTMSVIQKYEFVGGKVNFGEDMGHALQRECMEELDMQVEVGDLIGTVEYEYPEYVVRLRVFLCKRLSGFVLKEHDEQRWIPCGELDTRDWAPADGEIIKIVRNGHVSLRQAQTVEEYETIHELAQTIWHACYSGIITSAQCDYMVEEMLSPGAIEGSIRTKEYRYYIVYLNGEAAGFYSYCPAKYFTPEKPMGVFLSKLYLCTFARGKRITNQILNELPRPISLTVNKSNSLAIAVYKHLGFKIVKSIVVDIGGGYKMDDFVMELD